MNPRYRHGPIIDTWRKRCPVCHQPVYSLAGIHPQCAIKLADDSPPGAQNQAVAEADSPAEVTAAGIPLKVPPIAS
jgi:hypothetical protein